MIECCPHGCLNSRPSTLRSLFDAAICSTEEELLALRARLGAVVAGAECGEAAEELAHVGLVEALEEGLEVLLLVREFVREDFCERGGGDGTEKSTVKGQDFRFLTQ